MSIRSLTLLLAVAGGATYLYRRRPGGRPMLALPSPDEAGRWPLRTGASSAGMAQFGGADRSLEQDELMQDEHRIGTPVMPAGDMTGSGEGGRLDVAPETEELFGRSPSRRGEEPFGTGLPDLTRGA